MAFPTITFSASGGSDSQASGAGPASAVFGTNASFSGSTWTLDGSPDLSGVATDGSAVLWAQTSTGRQFFTINAKDNTAKTVTTDDAPSGTSTGRTWAIGGKRATLNNTQSRTLVGATGIKAGWTIDIDQSGGDQVLTSTLTINGASVGGTNGPITLKSSSGTRAKITSATNSVHLLSISAAHGWKVQHLEFTHTAGTRGNCMYATNRTNYWWWDDCVFDGFNTAIFGDFITQWSFHNSVLSRCEIKNCVSSGINNVGSNMRVIGSWIHDNGSHGIHGNAADGSPGGCSWHIFNSLITNNTGRGIYWQLNDSPQRSFHIHNSTIAGNGSNGIEIVGTTDRTRLVDVWNSIVYNNNGWGLLVGSGMMHMMAFYNAMGSNASGNYSNVTPIGDVTLSTDPFTDAASDDYTLNDDAGGGADCKEAGFGGSIMGMDTYLDLGALQSQGSGGGGGGGASKFAFS